ncbi:MAG: ABC transporter substrate-binding protein [Lentisphaeria bacterium]|jgi:NitT/TauT family transport system substrate-binding protein|nr:ABC transporter substrate-binding protein [Lentisphaeria bacterium]
MIRKQHALTLALTLVLGVAALSCRRRESGPEAIRIAYLPITHAVVLQELAGSGDVPVELIRYGSWPELQDALNTGRVEAASVLIESSMKAREQGIGLSALALGHRSGNVVILDQALATLADVRGRSFAIPHRNSSHYLLLREALSQAGIDISEVKIVELPPPEMPSALASGRIAGYCVAEPFGAVSVHAGHGKVQVHSDELWPDSICCALVANRQFVQSRPELAAKLRQAYLAAGERLADRTLAMSSAQAMLRQPAPVLELSLQWISYRNLALTRSAYDDLCDKVRRYGLSGNPPSYDDFVYVEQP